MSSSNGLCALVIVCLTSWLQAQELPRRVVLGTRVQPVSAETRQSQSLINGRGVEILETLPDSNAESIGLKPGDVLQSIAGKEIQDVKGFVELVGTLRATTPYELVYSRGGEQIRKNVELKELARETSDEFEVTYSSVSSKVERLRTVLTVPKGLDRVPVVVLLSGLGNAFVEHPHSDPTGMKALAYEITRKGLAVLRIEKPGCGDSEGGPARNVDFDSIVDGYVEAVRQLKQNSRINNQSIWLFGVSMGGFQAPLVAARENVQGVAVFGTMLPNWREFMVDSVRRQLLKTPASAVDIESDVAAHATGWHYVINEMMMPDDLAVKHQDLMDWVDSNFAEGLYFSGIHVKFFQQAGKADIAGCLEKLACPVLAIWGDEDIVTSNAGHQWLVDIVNRKHPGKASLVTLPRVDHNLQLHTASPESAAPIVVDKLHAWIKWAM